MAQEGRTAVPNAVVRISGEPTAYAGPEVVLALEEGVAEPVVAIGAVVGEVLDAEARSSRAPPGDGCRQRLRPFRDDRN